MNIIASYLGGSHSYGLSTSESDQDIRYVFLNTDIGAILGLSRYEHQIEINKENDKQGYELRHFLRLLRNGNTQSLELVFNHKWEILDELFAYIQRNRERLLDSKTIFRCLCGYAMGERKLIFGTAHRGQIGEKRRKAIEQYGYSYRNACHAFRLLRAGVIFFQTGAFPVDIVAQDPEYGQFIHSVKTNPSAHTPEDLDKRLESIDLELKKAYDNRSLNFSFDTDFANEICLRAYRPYLK
jgi:hypothetical protein